MWSFGIADALGVFVFFFVLGERGGGGVGVGERACREGCSRASRG